MKLASPGFGSRGLDVFQGFEAARGAAIRQLRPSLPVFAGPSGRPATSLNRFLENLR